MASDEDSVVIPPCRIVTTGVSASPLTDALADSGQTATWGAQHVGFNKFAHHAVVEQAGTASALHPAHNAAHAGMQRQRLSLDLGGVVPPGSGHGLAGRTSSAAADAAVQPNDGAQHGAPAVSPQCMAGMTQGRHPALGRLRSAEPGDAARQEAEDGGGAGEQDCDDEAARQAAVQQASDPTTNTRLVTGSEVILQNALLDVITAPGAAAMEVTQLFTFWRPQNECKSAKLRHLTHKQHDILYAVSGCSDVKFRIGNLNEAVRRALHDLYGLTIQGNTSDLQVWYKNRGNKEKSQAKAAAAAAAAASGGTVRRRRASGFASAAAGPGSAPGLAVRKTVKRGEPHRSPSSPAAAALLEGAAAATAAAAAAAGAGLLQAQMAVSVSGALVGGGADGHHRQLSAELLGGTAAKRHSTELLMRLQHAQGSADALCGGRTGDGSPAPQPHHSAEFFAGQLHEALCGASERPRSQGLSAGLQAYSQQQHRSAAAGANGRSGRDAAVGLIDRMRSAPPWQSPDARRQDLRAASACEQYPWIGTGHERAVSAGGEQAGWLDLAHNRAASAGEEQVEWGAMLRDEQARAAAGAERIGWGALAQERSAASAAAGGDAHIGWGAVGHVCSGSDGVEHLGWIAPSQDRAAAGAAAGPEVMDWGNAMAEAAHQYDMQHLHQHQHQPGCGQQLFDQRHLQQYEQELYYRQQQQEQQQQEQGLQLQQGASGADAVSFGSIFASVVHQQEQGLQLQRAASGAEAGSLGSIFASQARQQDAADAGSFGSIFASVARQQEQGLQQQRAASGAEAGSLGSILVSQARQQDAADAGSFGSIFASVARQSEVYDEALRAQVLSPPPQPLAYCGSRDAGHSLSSIGHASGSGQLRSSLGHASGSGHILSSGGHGNCCGHAVGGGAGRHLLVEELSLSGMEVTAATVAQEALASRLSSGSSGRRVGQPAPPQDAGLGFGGGAPGAGVGTAAAPAGRRSSRSSPLPGSTSADGVVAAATQGLIKVEDLHSEQPRVLLRQWIDNKAVVTAAAAAEAPAGGSGRLSSTNSGGSHSQGRLAYASHTPVVEQHYEHVGSFGRVSSIGQAASDQRPMASPFEIDVGVPRHSGGDFMQQQVMQAADARSALPAAAAATNVPAALAQMQQQQAPQRMLSAPSLSRTGRQPSCGPEALPFPSPFQPPDSLAHAVGATRQPGSQVDCTGLLVPAEDDRLQLTTSFSGGSEALLPSPGGALQPSSPFSIRGPTQPGAGGGTLQQAAGSNPQLAGGTLQSAAGSTLLPVAAGPLQAASPFLAMDGRADGGALPPVSLPGLPRSPQKQKRPLGLADLVAPPTSQAARTRPPSAGEVVPRAGVTDPVPPSTQNPTPIMGAPSFKDYLSTWISVGSQMPSIPSKHQRLVPAGTCVAVAVQGRGCAGVHDSSAGPRPMEGMTSGLFEGSTDLELMNAQLREFERQQRHGGAAATAAAAAHGGGGAGGPGRGMLPPPNRAPQPGAVATANAAGPDLSPLDIAAGVGPTGDRGAVEEALADGENNDSGLTLSSSMSLSLSLSLTLSLQDAPRSGPLSNSLSTPKSGPLSGAVSMQEAPKSGPMSSVALQEAPRSGGLSAPPSGDWMQLV